jgi:hypothetical protein
MPAFTGRAHLAVYQVAARVAIYLLIAANACEISQIGLSRVSSDT